MTFNITHITKRLKMRRRQNAGALLLLASLLALVFQNCSGAFKTSSSVASSQQLYSKAYHAGRGFHFNAGNVSNFGVFRQGACAYLDSVQSQQVNNCTTTAAPGDVPLAADYDGNGQTDLAYYRPFTSEFFWANTTGSQSLKFGDPGDVPLVGDFDGDGKTDIAAYDPTASRFWIILSSTGETASYELGDPGDIPVIGDFDGDGKSDIAVFQPDLGRVCYLQSSKNYDYTSLACVNSLSGAPNDPPVIGDFDGDGRDDIAFYHSATSTFYIVLANGAILAPKTLGVPGDTPLVGDFDGDGKSDIAIFHPGVGQANSFRYISSESGATSAPAELGNPGDDALSTFRYQATYVAPTGSFTALASARQAVYQNITPPHTDKNGHALSAYDSATSMFVKCAYASLPGTLAQLKQAGFNCAIPYNQWAWSLPALNDLQALYTEADASGVQINLNLQLPVTTSVQPTETTYLNVVNAAKTHASAMGWYIEQEASGCVDAGNCPTRFANYSNFMSQIRQNDPNHAIFNLDIPGSTVANYLSWWSTWNQFTDIAINDNYPFALGNESTIAPSIQDTIDLVNLNGQKKPTFITIQTFEQPESSATPFHWKMPTPQQIRVQAFAHLIHGATGLFYFSLDNWAVRNANVIGIAPATAANYPGAIPCTSVTAGNCDVAATAAEISSSVAAWNATASLNSELDRLTPAILSPTSSQTYSVSYQGAPVSSTPIRTLLKNVNGKNVLFVVNLDNVPLNFQVSGFSSQPFNLYSVDSSGIRSARASIGSGINGFTDSIDGFGVRIYEFQ